MPNVDTMDMIGLPKGEIPTEEMIGLPVDDTPTMDMIGLPELPVEVPKPEFPTITKSELVGTSEVSPFVGTPGEGLPDIAGKMGLKLGTDITPLDIEEMKQGFMETLSGYGHLAIHPYEIVRGFVDFATSIPGFLTGVGVAAQRGAKNALDQFVGGRFDLEEFHGELSKGMEDTMQFFEPGKEMLFGKAPETSHLVGATIIAPVLVSSAIGRDIAEDEAFKDCPNIRGFARLVGDIGGFLACGMIYRGPRAKLTKDAETIVRKAADIKAKEDLVAKTPDEAMRRAQERVLEVQKRQVELEAEQLKKEVQEGIDLDEPIKEDLKTKADEVKARKAGYVEPEFVEIEGVRYIKQEGKWYDATGKEVDVEAMKAIAKETKAISKMLKEQRGEFLRKEGLVEKEVEPITELDRPTIVEESVIRELEPAGEVYPPQEFPEVKPDDPYKLLADRLGDKHDAKYLGQDEGVVVKAGEKPRLLWSMKDDNRIFRTKGLNITELREKTDYLKAQKPESLIELDRQTGTPTPPVLEGESNPFFQTVEEAEGFRQLYEGRKSVTEDVEVFTQKVINDVSLAYHAKDEAALGKARDALSRLAVEADEFRTDFIPGKYHLEWKETVSNAAEWARGLRLEIQRREITVPRDRKVVGRIEPTQKPSSPEKFKEDIDSILLDLEEGEVYTPSAIEEGISPIVDLDTIWDMWKEGQSPETIEVAAPIYELAKETIKRKFLLRREGPKLYSGIPVDEITKMRRKLLRKPLYSIEDKIESSVRTSEGRATGIVKRVIINKTSPDPATRFRYEVRWDTGIVETIGQNRIQKPGEGPKLYSGLPLDAMTRLMSDKWKKVKGKIKEVVAYHATPKMFETFDVKFGESAGGKTLFFTSDPMGEGTPGVISRVIKARLRLKNTKEFDIKRAEDPKYQRQFDSDVLEKEGYDSVHYTLEDGTEVWSVLYNDQMKIIDPGPKLYSGLPLDEMGKNIIKMADKAIAAGKKAREFRKFKPLEAIKLLNEKYKRNWVDKHGNIRLDFLRKLDDEGYRIIQRMYLTKGADPLSTMELHQMRKEISSGLTRNEKRIRDDVVFNTRMADIANYKLPKDFSFPEGSRPLESAAYLELWAQREGVTPERARKIQSSVDGYFEWMKRKLYEMEEEGLISTAERKDLEVHKFSKLKLVDILDKENKLTIGGKVRTIHDSGIESLAKGRETDILERNSEVLALEHFERINGRILHNRANRLLKELAEGDPKNPFVRVRKPNESIPKGWQKIFVYEEGVRETLHISPELAKEWTTSNPEITYKMGQHLKWISGSPLLKTFATGIEWAFALRNVPRDVMHIYYAARVFENGKWKSVYSPHFPVFLPQIALDIARVFPDVVTKGPNLQAYYKRGGGMEFLTSQGLVLRRGRKLDSHVSNAQKALSRFGEISELTTRRAIEEHVLRMRAREKGISVEEARKDRAIMDEATFAAIHYMHFSQGGGMAKAIDNGIPYLNARIQASRGLWRVAKENPTMFVYKTAQLGALTTLLYSAMRSQQPKTTAALQGSADLRNNYCLGVGDDFSFEDEKGQTRYWGFKIPCDPAQKFFKAVFEGLYDMWAGYDVDVDRITKNIAELSPVESAPLFPTITAALEYTYNKDFWKDRDAWTRSKPFPWSTRDEEGKWVGSSREFIPGRTPQALVDIGEATRLSPERLKTAGGELVTENSTWMYLLGKGYDTLFADVPKEEKQKQWQMVLKEFPITSSFIFVTNPYSKYAEGIEEDVNIVTLKRLNERTELDRLTDGYLFTKSVERGEVMSYIRSFRDPRTKERLQDRFDFQYSIRNLPERSFWLRLQHLDPEVRARQYYKESQKSDRAEVLAAGRRVIGAAGGFFSDSFYDELNKIRRADEGEE